MHCEKRWHGTIVDFILSWDNVGCWFYPFWRLGREDPCFCWARYCRWFHSSRWFNGASLMLSTGCQDLMTWFHGSDIWYVYILSQKSPKIFSFDASPKLKTPPFWNCDSRNSSLQSLNLRNNRIGDEGIESIAEGLTMSLKEMLGWQAEFVIEIMCQ